MPKVKECPLCNGTMKLRQSETVTRVPGNPKPTKHISYEWICPDCDYFEEADDDEKG